MEKVAWTSPSRPSGKRIVGGDLLAPFLAAARKREIKRALFSRLPQCRAAKSGTCTKLVRPIAVQPRSRRKQVFQSTAALKPVPASASVVRGTNMIEQCNYTFRQRCSFTSSLSARIVWPVRSTMREPKAWSEHFRCGQSGNEHGRHSATVGIFNR